VAANLGIALMHDLTMPTLRPSVVARPLAGRSLARRVTAVTAAGRRSPAAAPRPPLPGRRGHARGARGGMTLFELGSG
jgi:hypothetical protein